MVIELVILYFSYAIKRVKYCPRVRERRTLHTHTETRIEMCTSAALDSRTRIA